MAEEHTEERDLAKLTADAIIETMKNLVECACLAVKAFLYGLITKTLKTIIR